VEDFEKLGVFYLGKEYDLESGSLGTNLVLYDSKDLNTHAVCVGMTGSGKTGLCISLLEEALIDGIPAIVIDPKGDLCNLLLTFPDLKPEDFRPWVNEEDARKRGLSAEEFSRQQAELWEKGLTDWGQGRDRIRRLKDAGDMAIYTPGSDAGMRVSILKSFAAPAPALLEDADLLREKINTTVTSLLSLLGIEADPVQSREHILLSAILHAAWREGKALDLAGLIQSVQNPPFNKMGVLDLESFYPSKDRFSLAMRMNNLLAAPGWSAWFEGESLDIDKFLYAGDGRPKISVFHISHLNDAERMFFVSILLAQMLDWMRRQSGTTSLRALFYMDEIFGYMPPVANPPSKGPLLALLKQARAFGLGIVLATQNPVDLDYKGLSNAGTWFIGRLQTDRDKERLLDGLEGVGGGAGVSFDRQKMGRILAGLGSRVFLMNNVHEDAPVVFQSRWALSYLCGPVTRSQIRQLTAGQKTVSPDSAISPVPEEGVRETVSMSGAQKVGVPVLKGEGAGSASAPPLVPPGIGQWFLPVRKPSLPGASLYFEPRLIAGARVPFKDAKANVSEQMNLLMLADFPSGASTVNWDDAEEAGVREEELIPEAPVDAALFGALPKVALDKSGYPAWNRSFKDWIYRTRSLELLRCPSSKIVSAPGENERDFRIRLQMAARESRDAQVERLREKYQSKIFRLEERVRAAEYAVAREKEQASQQKIQTAISIGATLFSAFLGRKAVSRTSVGRATTTIGRAGRILKETKDVDRAEDNLQTLQAQVSELQSLMNDEIETIRAGTDPLTEKLETYRIEPDRSGLSVSLVALAWTPYWQDGKGGLIPAW
jgi:hypothetical protein